MRTFSKKALSIVLCLLFVVGCVISVAAAGKKFDDVGEKQWFYKYVDYMSQKGVIAGHGGTNLFKPGDNVKRNEFIKMINSVFGLTEEADTTFEDVDAGSWYEPFYKAAYKQGYLQRAFGDIVFQTPKKDLTREEAVALLMAYLDPKIDISNQTLDFSDAIGITPRYRNFVIQAVYQGIIVGYTDGTFKPQGTLSRAEAATMLCKAAGTVLTAKSTAFAPETDVCGNAVINGNGVSLNFHVNGDLIITEAVDGKIEVKDSIILGTVYVRGKGSSNVEFVNCQIHNVIVQGNASVMLSGGTTVENYTIENTSLTVMDNASVKNFTVAAAAKNSTIRSEDVKDTVENYAIYASGFNSAVLHTGNIVFGDGIKATIANKVYSGSGFVEDSLRTCWAGGYEYIKYTTSNDGYVDYFYSKSEVSTSNFADRYKSTSASLKHTKTVTTGLEVNEKTLGASMDYKYLVIGFRTGDGKYNDVKNINRETELYGIKGDVSVTYDAGGKFKVSFTIGIHDNAHPGWKAYYAFTDDKNFGTADVKDIKKFNTLKDGDIFNEEDAEGKKYIAVFIYENNIVHTPKLAEIPVFYNGFISVPTVTIKGGNKEDELSYSIAGNGTAYIKYFYVDNVTENHLKSEKSFDDEYNAIDIEHKGTISCSGTGIEKLRPASDVGKKMHVVICVKGNKPFYVTRMYDGTGFADNAAPKAYKIGIERAISFTPSINGTLKYVYVESDKILTTKEFNSLYGKEGAIKGEIKNCSKNELEFAKISATYGTKDYVAVMLSDGSADYQPICVKFTDPGTGVKSAAFSADIIAGTQKLTATQNFEDATSVYYYEAFYFNPGNIGLQVNFDAIKTYTDNVLANMAFEQAKSNTTIFRINADGTFNGGGAPKKEEKQIVLRLVIKVNDSDTYIFKPFILDISKFDYGFDVEDVVVSTKDGREIIKLDLEQAGTIKCYYTSTKPADIAAFDKGYAAAAKTYRNSKTVTADKINNIQMGDGYFVYALSEYKYIAFMFEDDDGKRTPQVFEREKKSTTGIVKVTAVPKDHNSFRIDFEVMDIFKKVNVTPVFCSITSKDKMTNIDLDSLTNFEELNGEKDTAGLIGLSETTSNDINYVYIIIGAKRGDEIFKFKPYEVKLPRVNAE